MTDIVPYDDQAIMAMLAEYQPQPDIQDIERIRKLMLISNTMAEHKCTHTEAIKIAGLSSSTIYRWRETRPWVHSIASRLLLARMDREIDDMVLAYFKEGLELLCEDFVNPELDAEVRLAIHGRLYRTHIQPLADELEAMERQLAKSEQAKSMVRRRRNYQPVATLMATIVLPDGRSVLPGSKAFEGEFEVIDSEADETDQQTDMLE